MQRSLSRWNLLSTVPWSTPLNELITILAGAFYPLMRWRRERFWGQERTGRGRKTDREVGETTMKSVRERGCDGDGDQWNAATICVRCQTALKHILLFNEKRGDEKENSSAKKNTDVVEADEGEETLSSPEQLLLVLSRLLLVAWKNPSLPAHTQRTQQVCSQLLSEPF